MTMSSDDPAYEGRALPEWVASLRDGDAVERCTAALALGEFGTDREDVRAALERGLSDADGAVRCAVKMALGVIHSTPEARRGFFRLLRAGDGPDRLGAVRHLRGRDAEATGGLPGEAALQGPAGAFAAGGPPSAPGAEPRDACPECFQPVSRDEKGALPSRCPNGRCRAWLDFSHDDAEAPTPTPKESVPAAGPLPSGPARRAGGGPPAPRNWTRYVPPVVLVLASGILSWALAELWYWPWLMAGLALLGGIVLLGARRQARPGRRGAAAAGKLTPAALVVLAAGLCGLAVGVLCARSAVYVENATPLDVRLVLDGKDWLTLGPRERRRVSLTWGTYTLTVYPPRGENKLDEHAVPVSAHRQYVLNVLGAQTYYRGTVYYGVAARQPVMQEVWEKWFEFDVDYPFQDPPASIVLPRLKGIPVASEGRTFLSRGAPPGLGPPAP